MCAIVDANVAHEVFSSNPQPAGEKFFDWIIKGSGRLVVGGKLLGELEASSEHFREWAAVAQSAGKMRIVPEREVGARAEYLQREGECRSNDHHVIALAQVSGARLLYSNDKRLQQDFKNSDLVRNPGGSVYSTLRTKNFSGSHRNLLRRQDLCGPER